LISVKVCAPKSTPGPAGPVVATQPETKSPMASVFAIFILRFPGQGPSPMPSAGMAGAVLPAVDEDR
jgi:hypothetical protein